MNRVQFRSVSVYPDLSTYNFLSDRNHIRPSEVQITVAIGSMFQPGHLRKYHWTIGHIPARCLTNVALTS